MRKVEVLGQGDCSAVLAQDSLGAMSWTCLPTTPDVTIVSYGLQTDKNLSDLIDWQSGDWLPMSVTVSVANTPILTTTSATWQTNPVAAYGAATAAGTIYLVTASATPPTSYSTPNDRTAVVIQPGMTLAVGSSGLSNNNNFTWLEGAIDAAGASQALTFLGAFGVGRNLSSLQSTEQMNCSNSRFHHVRLANDEGFLLLGSGNLFDDLSWNNSKGTFQDKGSRNLFAHLKAFNNPGFILQGQDEVYTQALIASTLGGLTIYGSAVLIAPGLMQNSFGELSLLGSNETTVVGMVAYGDGGGSSSALSLTAPAQAATVANANFADIEVEGSGSGVADIAANGPNVGTGFFSGLLWVADQCNNGTPASFFSGLAPAANADCAIAGSSDAMVNNLGFSSPVGAEFIGAVTTESANTTSGLSNGTAANPNSFDWFNFDNPYQGWGPLAADVSTGARCILASTCQIWDYRLRAGGADLLGKPIAAAAGAAADSQLMTHTWVATNATDCALIPGAVFAAGVCQSVFLRRAIELIGPTGNQNGLCESNEVCLYTPNFGAYQGEGVLAYHDPISIGAVTNVTLVEYSTHSD